MVQKHFPDVSGRRPVATNEGSHHVSQPLDIHSDDPYTLTFSQGNGYLHARVRAETVTLETATEYMRAIANECRTRGQKRVLIEREVPAAMPLAHMISIVENMTGLLAGIKVAFVNPYREIDESLQFLVLAATNRSTEASVHPTLKAARDWLAD